MSGKQIKGKCKYCGKELTYGYMLKHVTSCSQRIEAIGALAKGKECGYYEIAVYPVWGKSHWLILEVEDEITLADIDHFLRDIWLECCGHLSAFDIDGVSFEAYHEDSWDEAEGMDVKLKKVFNVGMIIGYEYDFGSSTDLCIHVVRHVTHLRSARKINILSRNNSYEYVCGECDKPAEYIDAMSIWGMDSPFLCEECADKVDEDAFLLRVCNSPRMGVCGYNGSNLYPDDYMG